MYMKASHKNDSARFIKKEVALYFFKLQFLIVSASNIIVHMYTCSTE